MSRAGAAGRWSGVVGIAVGPGLLAAGTGWMLAALAGGGIGPGGVALLAGLAAVAGAVAGRLTGRREVRSTRRAMAAGLAHDFRTPLAQIRMYVEMMLLGRDRTVEEREAWLESIDRDARSLGDLLDNVVLFVHGQDLDPFPARRPVELSALVEDVAADSLARARASGMSIEVERSGPATVLADFDALRRALRNVLESALRFGPAGQVVRVTLSHRAGQALVRVVDQGSIASEEQLRTAWEPFPPDDTGGNGRGSAGLARAVARQIVLAHGGRCTIARTPVGGTELALTLPLASPF